MTHAERTARIASRIAHPSMGTVFAQFYAIINCQVEEEQATQWARMVPRSKPFWVQHATLRAMPYVAHEVQA